MPDTFERAPNSSIRGIKNGQCGTCKGGLTAWAFERERNTELISGNDGKFRVARLLLPSMKVLRRLLNLLYPSECGNGQDIGTAQDKKQFKETENDTSISLHPILAATDRARKHMQKHFYSEMELQHDLGVSRILTNVIFELETRIPGTGSQKVWHKAERPDYCFEQRCEKLWSKKEIRTQVSVSEHSRTISIFSATISDFSDSFLGILGDKKRIINHTYISNQAHGSELECWAG